MVCCKGKPKGTPCWESCKKDAQVLCKSFVWAKAFGLSRPGLIWNKQFFALPGAPRAHVMSCLDALHNCLKLNLCLPMLPFAELNHMFPLLFLKAIDFTTGHTVIFPGDHNGSSMDKIRRELVDGVSFVFPLKGLQPNWCIILSSHSSRNWKHLVGLTCWCDRQKMRNGMTL